RVVIEGDTNLSQDDCRPLADLLPHSPDFAPPAPLVCNQVAATPWALHYPQITNLIGLYVADRKPLGWLIALNKGGGELFRRSDAALLLPFAALLGLQLRSIRRYQDLKDLLVGLT